MPFSENINLFDNFAKQRRMLHSMTKLEKDEYVLWLKDMFLVFQDSFSITNVSLHPSSQLRFSGISKAKTTKRAAGDQGI